MRRRAAGQGWRVKGRTGCICPRLLKQEPPQALLGVVQGVGHAVEGIAYDVHPGEMVAIVGESGGGKSVSALSIMRLLPKLTARFVGGKILFGGRNLLELSDSEMRSVRGREISMIFQEPMTSLNPVLKIGFQLTEARSEERRGG